MKARWFKIILFYALAFAVACGGAVVQPDANPVLTTAENDSLTGEELPTDPLEREAYLALETLDSNFRDFYTDVIKGDVNADGRVDLIVEYGVGFEAAARSMLTAAWLFVNSESGLLEPVPFYSDCCDVLKIESGIIFLDEFRDCALIPELVSHERFKYHNGILVPFASYLPDPEEPEKLLYEDDRLQRGMIMPDPMRDNEAYAHMLIPFNGFTIYDNEFNETGRLMREDEFVYVYGFRDNSRDTLREKYVVQIDDEVYALEFTAATGGYVKIAENSWISVEEIVAEGFEPWGWEQVLLNQMARTFDPMPGGVELKNSPGPGSGTICKISDNGLFLIELTGQVNGLWVETVVTEYISSPYDHSFDEENIRRQSTGWIKLLDEDGLPAICYAPRGI